MEIQQHKLGVNESSHYYNAFFLNNVTEYAITKDLEVRISSNFKDTLLIENNNDKKILIKIK